MNEGSWLDQPPPNTTLPTLWQPPGCVTHKYNPTDTATCFAHRRVLFAGDSTIRQVFWAVAQTLDADAAQEAEARAERHADIRFARHNVELEFVWDPFLNGTKVGSELGLFEGDKYYDRNPSRPALMLVGSGLWYSRFETVNSMKKWRNSMDEVVGYMRQGRTTTDVTRQDLLLLAPVPIPAFARLNEARRKTITKELVGEMNQYLQQLSDIHGIDVVWAFSLLTQDLPQVFESSGLHLHRSVVAKQAEILLNLRCNAELPPKYPNDKTCCQKYAAPNAQQWVGLLFVLAVLPVMSYLRSKGGPAPPPAVCCPLLTPGPAESRRVKPAAWLPSERAIHALLVFGMAVVYCFYADRTQVFHKMHKRYTGLSFAALTAAWLAAGCLSVRRSDKPFARSPDQVLSRDQTDEWKGWLQFAILVYHYTGASRVAWIYGLIRVAVASYLFMTGYGHAAFFYKKADYSFRRVAGVLVRLNLLSCVLPYMMRTEYIFYYFAPLVSFWFLVVYATMRLGAQHNGSACFVLGKIAVSALLTATFIRLPGILEAVFAVPHLLAGTEWSVYEFRFRVSLDMFIVHVGMAVAIATIKLGDSSSPYTASFRALCRHALVAAAAALPLFFVFQITRESKFAYNACHPYVSWIPILSFVALRNATQKLRSTYSAVFAWLGRCSLETFTLQFHIWMAADTHGLLNLGFEEDRRWTNFVLVTAVFLFVSSRVASATADLTAWILDGPEASRQLPTTRAGAGDDAKPEGGTATDTTGLFQHFSSLKVRCAAMLVGMWILNLVSCAYLEIGHWILTKTNDRPDCFFPLLFLSFFLSFLSFLLFFPLFFPFSPSFFFPFSLSFFSFLSSFPLSFPFSPTFFFWQCR